MTQLRALVVGAGSIGQRHLRNLRQVGTIELAVCDPDATRREASGDDVRRFSTLDEALSWQPQLALIATPTHLHLSQATACAQRDVHLFIEKPLATTLDGVAALGDEVRRRGLHAVVGCNLRFDDVYAAVTQALETRQLGRVFAAQLYFGYDLRSWRPGIDYRDVYSAWRHQGGGILLDAIHEIDLALRWFGRPRRLLSLPRRTGALTGDVEDVADLIVSHRSGVVTSLHLDYRDPVYRRTASVSGDVAVVEGDFARRTVLLRGREASAPQTFADDRNAMYVRQLEHFVELVRGQCRPATVLDEGALALEVALAARDRAPLVEFDAGPRLERVPVVIQARLGSTRLPGKVLMPAAGRPMLQLLVERLRRARRVERVILATSEAPADRRLVEEAERLAIPCFVGSEHDVLGRYLGAMRRFDLPAVVRITADCPLTDPAVVDAAIARFVDEQPDYLSNVHPRSYPDGLDVEVISREAMERADRQALAAADREHVTQYIVHHPERFEQMGLPHPDGERLAPLRWTLDTATDYEFLRAVIEALHPTKPDFGLQDVLEVVARTPALQLLRDRAAAP